MNFPDQTSTNQEICIRTSGALPADRDGQTWAGRISHADNKGELIEWNQSMKLNLLSLWKKTKKVASPNHIFLKLATVFLTDSINWVRPEVLHTPLDFKIMSRNADAGSILRLRGKYMRSHRGRRSASGTQPLPVGAKLLKRSGRAPSPLHPIGSCCE